MRFIIILLFSFFIGVSSAQKHEIHFNDFFGMQRLGNFSVSPNGRYIAFDLSIPDIKANNIPSTVWIHDLSSGLQHQLSPAGISCSGPVWSKDGKSVFYNRAGQIWEHPVMGGKAHQISQFKPGAGGMVFSPNGQNLLFTSDVDPNCETPQCMEESFERQKNKVVHARLIDHLFFRHWNRWLEGNRSHVFIMGKNGKNLRDITPGDFDTPPLDLGSSHDYVFSPDGKSVVFVRNTDPVVATSTNNDLFSFDLSSGKVSQLTNNRGNDNGPAFSADGRYLAWSSMARAGFEADRYRIMLRDLSSGKTRELTVGFNLSANNVSWSPDDKSIYFTAAERGAISLYKVDIVSGKINAVLKGHFIGGYKFIDPGTLVLKIQTAAMPYELFTYDLQKNILTQISHINTKKLAGLDLSRLQSFWFKGAFGDSVQGFILKPPHFNPAKQYPAIHLIHGGPQGEWGDDFHYRWNYQMFAAPGYVVYVINFHGSVGYGQKFTDAVSGNWGDAPYKDLVLGTQYVIKNFPYVDGDRLGAAGASYGGFMINWIEGHDNPYKCLVSHDGVFDQRSMYGATEELWFPEWEFKGLYWNHPELYEKYSPSSLVANFKTPMLVIHGEKDYRVPYTQGLQLFTALQRQGVESRLLFFPDEDHFVRKPQNARLWWHTVHSWFEKYLN